MAEALQKSVGRGFNLGRWSFFSCRLPSEQCFQRSTYNVYTCSQRIGIYNKYNCTERNSRVQETKACACIQEWSTLLEVVWSASIHGKAMQMQRPPHS